VTGIYITKTFANLRRDSGVRFCSLKKITWCLIRALYIFSTVSLFKSLFRETPETSAPIAGVIASTLNIVWPFNCWFRRTQYITSIGLIYKEVGRLWRVSDCEELVGVTHRR